MTRSGGKRIADYGLIADGQTAALVSRDGSIDWMCVPHFDSDACFAALLGDDDNGCWRMAPAAPGRITRHYLDETLILETRFETEGGEVKLTDFMPIRGQAPDIVRIVEGVRGQVAMCSDVIPRFGYGLVHPLVRTDNDGETLAVAGPDALRLAFDVPIEGSGRSFTSRFTVSEGERLCFTLTWFASHLNPPDRVDPEKALAETRDHWREWSSRCRYQGRYRPQVIRSLLTLKAAIHTPTGGMVAAPTASLPERPGGDRNWDYRYCWLRDATFTLIALVRSGYREEAAAWSQWLRRAVAGEPIDVQPFYTIDAGWRIPEWTADWLGGFNGAGPVRFGNAAANQCQLDVYGEVLDALVVARRHGMDEQEDRLVHLLARRLEELWRRPDAGIWESRGEPRHHVYSKAMCWVAFDRAARWFEDDPETRDHYRELAEEVRADVLAQGYDEGLGHFTRAYDDPALDASALLLPLVGFIPADDPRMKSTVAAFERQLVEDGLVRRYTPEKTDDGVGGGEGAFIACGFWLADVYVLQGRMAEAEALFDRLCGSANDLGLLSEEIDPGSDGLLGNFPQSLSHLSLIWTALALDRQGNADRNDTATDPRAATPWKPETGPERRAARS